MKWLGLDQVISSVNHVGWALTHEQIKRYSPYLQLFYAYLQGKDISKQNEYDKKKNIIIPNTINNCS